jgi:hypothetical protein
MAGNWVRDPADGVEIELTAGDLAPMRIHRRLVLGAIDV